MEPKREISDLEIIERYLANDLPAFDMLYEKYKRPLYAYVSRMLSGNTALADDIFQQAWIRIISKLAQYRDDQKFLPWAMRISHNIAVDHFRKSSREVPHDFTENPEICPSFDQGMWRNIDSSQLAAEIENCIGRLPAEQREVFSLRQEELSFRDISAMQGCSINTVLARMQYALRNLQKCLSKWSKE